MQKIKRNWVPVLTIAIALVGGLPGLVSTYSALTAGPELNFKNNAIGVGLETSTGKPALTFFGTLNNTGNRSVNIMKYSMEVYEKDAWVQLDPIPYMKNISYGNSETAIKFAEGALPNIQKKLKFEPDEAYQGFIVFIDPNHTYDYYKQLQKFRFTVQDTLEKRYVFTFSNTDYDVDGILPNIGVSLESDYSTSTLTQ
jgi:hypothetical protein